MKALVIGGTGPTGPYIVNGLLERGYEVTILHRGTHEVEFSAPVEHLHGDPFDVEALKGMLPEGMSMVQMALRWILDHEAVSAIIPGASSPEQARANAAISDLPPLPQDLHRELAAFYRERVHEHVRGPY